MNGWKAQQQSKESDDAVGVKSTAMGLGNKIGLPILLLLYHVLRESPREMHAMYISS